MKEITRASAGGGREISFLIHKDVKTESLPLYTLDDIFGRKKKNWGSITAQDVDIQVFALAADKNDGRQLEKLLFSKGKTFGKRVSWVKSYEEIQERVSRTPGTTKWGNGQCRFLTSHWQFINKLSMYY